MTQEEIKRHRVESVLKELLPEAFSSLNDERINSLAVNDVKCSKGRSNAKVYLDKSFLNEKEQGEALKQLRKVGAYLQNHCKQSEGWFKAPIFTFEFDQQIEEVSRIEDLFKQIAGRNKSKDEDDKKDSTDES
jgi:ribosome-binding factor A